jgi:hypothetical protein
MPTKHRFDGKWIYFQYRDGALPGVPPLRQEAVLVIPDRTNGIVDPSSTIHGKRITSGTADPQENTLELFVTEPGNIRHYLGERVKDFPGGKEPLLIITGRFKDYAQPIKLADQKNSKLLAQDEGTWIIIK